MLAKIMEYLCPWIGAVLETKVDMDLDSKAFEMYVHATHDSIPSKH
jgi:hypothetical protein